MKIYVDQRWEWDCWDVYLFQESYEDGKQGLRLAQPNPETGYPELTGEFVPDGEAILGRRKPYVRLRMDVVDAIVAKRKNVRLDETVTEALNDTRQVRDRLLTLIETRWNRGR